MKRPLGNTSYQCHPLGFGSYRVNEGNPVHEAALRAYFDAGGNLVDTSSNYGDGLSEILVGRVVKDFVRDNIIVVTKAGYMQGQNLRMAGSRSFPDVVKYANGLWHCIHPEFLETQLEQSLRRMKLDTIDFFLLHNPEYFINFEARQNPLSDEILNRFYDRIRLAFEFMEKQVARGTIKFYGVSSNNFGFHEKDRARVSVHRLLQEAAGISKDHHFRAVQLPLNLFESGGALFRTNEGRTVLDYCRENGLGVLVNRPLNAIRGNRMSRLADFVTGARPGPDDLDDKLNTVREAERYYDNTFGGERFGDEGQGLAAYLKFIALDLPSPDRWDYVLEKYIIPPVTHWLQLARSEHGEKGEWKTWQERYVAVVNQALDDVNRYLQSAKQEESDRIRAMISAAGYEQPDNSLSRIALSVLLGLNGVSCVLCGMRSPAYVADTLGAENLSVANSAEILEKISATIASSNSQ